MEPTTVEHFSSESTQGDRFTVRRRHVARGAILTLVLFVTSLLVGGSGALGADSNGVMFGAFSSPTGGENNITAVQNLEKQLGAKLPLVRGFERWDSTINNRFNNFVVDGDRKLMLSVKPQRNNGQKIGWRAIANAQPGSTIHNEMIALARGTKALDGEVWMTFHHEPEASTNTSHGSSADFIAAWRKFHTVFKQQGADVTWVWTMTSWSFEVNTSDRRSAGKWYPGDGYVDYLGADPYNWAQCRGSHEKDVSLERVITPFIEFAKKYPSKKLVLPEFGAHETGRKGAWFDEANKFMKQPEMANKFAAIIYFDDTDSAAPRCNWPIDSSWSSLNAVRRMAQDPFFNGSGSSSTPTPTTAAPTPTTAAPTPTTAPKATTTTAPQPTRSGEVTLKGSCGVEAVNGVDKVTWTPQGNGWGYNVRRNGKWVANVGERTWLNNNKATSGTYVIVARKQGQIGRFTCTRKGATAVAAPAPSGSTGYTTIPAKGNCGLRLENGSYVVTWPSQGDGFTYEVMRNGVSIGETTRTWLKHQNVTSGTYEVMARKGSSEATISCRRI